MPLPKPEKNEDKNSFIKRCLGNKNIKNDFPKQKQALAVCYSLWERRNKSEKMKKTISKSEAGNIMKKLSEVVLTVGKILENSDIKEMSDVEEKVATTNTPAWGSIPKTKENFPNKSDFIVQRGDTWSSWKLPYRYHGKVHCGGTRAAYAASQGAHQGKKMNLTPEEKARLEKARKLCGFGK